MSSRDAKKRKIETEPFRVQTKLNQIGDDCMKQIFEFMQDFEPFELMTTCKQFRDGVQLLDKLLLGCDGVAEDHESSGQELEETLRNKLNGWLESKYCRNYECIQIGDSISTKEANFILEKCKQLKKLSFEVCNNGKLTIPKFSNLERLEIKGSYVLLYNELPTLKSLSLLTPVESCQDIVKNFPNLEELLLEFKGNDLSPLKSLKYLKSLHIITCPKSKMKADQIYESMGIPTLETFKIDMNGPYSLCDPFIRKKITCPQLKTLQLSHGNYLGNEMEDIPEEEDIDALIFQLATSNFPKLENIKLEFGSAVQQLDDFFKCGYISSIKSLKLLNISHDCFNSVCNNHSLKGITELDCRMDMSEMEGEESIVFQSLSESHFVNLKTLNITYEDPVSGNVGFKEFCASENFTKLEHLKLGLELVKKESSCLAKSNAFPNLKSLFVSSFDGKISTFLNAMAKNESFAKLEEFTTSIFVEMSDLNKLKKSSCLKRLARVTSEDNETND